MYFTHPYILISGRSDLPINERLKSRMPDNLIKWFAVNNITDDERIQTWRELYDRAAQALAGEDLSRIMDRTATRSEA